MKYNAKMKAETERETTILRSDGGGEYCSKDFENWLGKAGISHQVTPPYTPQLNGVAERTNRTVIESARSKMYGKKGSPGTLGIGGSMCSLCSEQGDF